MRICYIAHGSFEHVVPYLNYFRQDKDEVHFISLTPFALDCVVTVHDVSLGGIYSVSRGKWKYPISMIRARRLVRKLKPDIVHTHYVTSGGLTGVVCGFHPTLTTVHGSDLNSALKSPLWRPLLKVIFNYCDCVNTCNHDQKRKLITLGVDPDKIRVVTLGVDTNKFSFAGVRNKTGRVLRAVTTRRLEMIYDHPTLIKALAILKSQGMAFQMTFVNTGSLMEKLKRQVEQLGLTDCVTFLGGVDKSEVVNILHQNDIFVSTPIQDGISIALLEAMAVGLFPIVSDIEVNRDWLQNGRDGFLHGVGDENSLAQCFKKVIKNPQIMTKAVERNQKKVVERGDTKTNMKTIKEIYRELVEKYKTF
ncbi:glycosyltransferase [Planctomycetota bacterium]